MQPQALFAPKSIAIVGASTKPGSVGNDILKNLVAPDNGKAFGGPVYPVNPKATELFNIPCFASLKDIPHTIDLAIIIVPAAAVPGVLEEAGVKEIPAAIIISAGFKEAGEAGKELEQQVQAVCEKYSITLLGPNCLGLINPSINLNASFAPLVPQAGNIAFLSQSGALVTAILDFTQESGLGFSKFASLGNKASLKENELLRYLAQDDDTKVIAFYSEDLSNATALIDTGRAILSRAEAKPIVALKAGLTEAGAGASASHTGSLGGSEAAYRALFKQARIIQAETLEELLNFSTAFSYNGLPESNRLAIVTNAGGPGVLATDAATRAGLELAKLHPETESRLKEILPPAAGTHNPVDVLGDAKADRYQGALDLLIQDDNVDSILVILTPQTTTEIEKTAQAIIDTKKKTQKPIVAIFAGEGLVKPGKELLEKARVTTLRFPEEGAKALGALAKVTGWRKENTSTVERFTDVQTEKVRAIFNHVRTEGRSNLLEAEGWDVLEAYGFPILRKSFVTSPEEALTAAQSIGSKVALKIVSPDILHKSDAGGVMLHVEPADAARGYTDMLARVAKNVPTAKLEGALVVEMAQPGGREVIIGMKKEPGLGTLIMFGLGGIYVEVFKDVAFRFAPLTRSDIQEMMRETKSFALLAGARGQAGVDLEKLEECVARLSQLVTDFPEIEELDVNPLLAFPNGADFRLLDAVITISEKK